MTYSQALAVAIQYYGENWHKDCSILQHQAADGHLGFLVSTRPAAMFALRRHPGHQ